MKRDWQILLLLFWAAVFVYSRGLNWLNIEYRDDEVFYYRASSEMLADGHYLSPTYFGEKRFQKPILFYWFVMLAYKIFGVSWFAARITAVIFAGMTLVVTWLIGRDLFDRRTAWLGTLILAVIPLFFRHAKNAVPDMPLNFFIVAAVYAGIRFSRNPQNRLSQILFFVLCGLGFMIKGFAAIVVPWLTAAIALLCLERKEILARLNFPLGGLIVFGIAAPWFIYMIKIHGRQYFDYMLVQETENRLIEPSSLPLVFRIVFSFLHNVVFYLQVLLRYFAPWCIFLPAAMGLACIQTRLAYPRREGLIWMLSWFSVVFLFFCLIHVTLNHYLLVLSTPFALMTAHFFWESAGFARGWRVALSGFFMILLAFGFLGISFLHVVLAGGNPVWFLFYLMVAVAAIAVLVRYSHPSATAAAFGLFMTFVFIQTRLFAMASISTHPTLQRFAATIHAQMSPKSVIGVVSHDLHEKELQVYFADHLVQKVGSDTDPVTHWGLRHLLETNPDVFSLVIQNDYDKFRELYDNHKCVIIEEEYMIRKRWHMDRGFVGALLKLDRKRIDSYFKEKVYLVHKPDSV